MQNLAAHCELTTHLDGPVKEFVAAQFRHPVSFSANDRAIGWIRPAGDGVEIVGGVVLCPRGGGWDAELSIVIAPVCRVTRDHIGALFEVAFEGFGLQRLTCEVARANKRARRFVENLGFRHEGTLRRRYDGTQTALLYGMTVDECRWLRR